MFADLRGKRLDKPSIFNAIVAPRPIAWVSTLDAQGSANLAPFSYFNLLANRPPTVVFSCANPDDRREKDTLANIRASGQFVINLVSRELLEQMHSTSTPVPAGVSEFEQFGIEPAPSENVRPPRVRHAPASLECELLQLVPIAPDLPQDIGGTAIIGRIVGLHLERRFIDGNGRFDSRAARLMARLGGNMYSELGEITELAPLARRE